MLVGEFSVISTHATSLFLFLFLFSPLFVCWLRFYGRAHELLLTGIFDFPSSPSPFTLLMLTMNPRFLPHTYIRCCLSLLCFYGLLVFSLGSSGEATETSLSWLDPAFAYIGYFACCRSTDRFYITRFPLLQTNYCKLKRFAVFNK